MTISSAFALFAAACGSPSSTTTDAHVVSTVDASSIPPVYVEATWQVRCRRFDGTPFPAGCSEPPARSVYGYNFTDQQLVACSMIEGATTRTVDFSASGRGADGSAFTIAATGLTIPLAGGAAEAMGSFRFLEGGVSYIAPIGPDAPSPAQPCQVSAVPGSSDGTPTLTVSVYCVEASSTTDATLHRGATLAGDGSGQELMPFPITFYDCPVTR